LSRLSILGRRSRNVSQSSSAFQSTIIEQDPVASPSLNGVRTDADPPILYDPTEHPESQSAVSEHRITPSVRSIGASADTKNIPDELALPDSALPGGTYPTTLETISPFTSFIASRNRNLSMTPRGAHRGIFFNPGSRSDDKHISRHRRGNESSTAPIVCDAADIFASFTSRNALHKTQHLIIAGKADEPVVDQEEHDKPEVTFVHSEPLMNTSSILSAKRITFIDIVATKAKRRYSSISWTEHCPHSDNNTPSAAGAEEMSYIPANTIAGDKRAILEEAGGESQPIFDTSTFSAEDMSFTSAGILDFELEGASTPARKHTLSALDLHGHDHISVSRVFNKQ